MKSLIQRTGEARVRFISNTGDDPDQLFLGPKEYHEFNQLCLEYGIHITYPGTRRGPDEFMGMTIIGLMSDGLRVGRTESA